MDCQSCSLSPTHMVVMSMPRPGKVEASPYGYEYLRCRENSCGITHDWNKHSPLRGGGVSAKVGAVCGAMICKRQTKEERGMKIMSHLNRPILQYA